MPYDHLSLEAKWQKFWEENKSFKTENDFSKPKHYCLDMFPYPSGAGLHVGHPKGFVGNDIYARYKHTTGYNILHPMGWDAFGLPAENYAIKTGVHPRITTDQNIANYKRQLKSLGLAYDWDREVDTTDPEYYKWTQWIFLKMFEAGLAYEQDLPINYCPSCKTGLANEEVNADHTCDRCGTLVEKRKIRQWVLAITKYADRLLADVDTLDWPEGIKEMQRNWIGKSEGCEFEMKKSDDTTKSIRVYTTRIDTVYGMTYAVMAPDHRDVELFITPEHRQACESYIVSSKSKSDQDRTNDAIAKTGVFTGSHVINPYNGESVPLWIADYVLGHYGTGTVMAVPAHDERDFAFAKKYSLPIKWVIAPYVPLTGASAPRGDKPINRKYCVSVIIKHPSENQYLLLKWLNGGSCGFVGGGVESGESLENACIREVHEETGYKNIRSIEVALPLQLGHGYKARKDCDCLNPETIFFVELEDLEHDELSEEDTGVHEPIWVEKDNIAQLITKDHHLASWKWYLSGEKPFTQDGAVFLSGSQEHIFSSEARKVLTEKAEKEGFGEKKVNYKLRDWLFSRQRYWGEPIPLMHLDIEQIKQLPHIADITQATDPNIAYILKRDAIDGECVDGTMCHGKVRELVVGGKVLSKIYDGINSKIIIDWNLPLKLPQVEKYEPAGDGQSPLATVPEFVHVEIAQNLIGKRETNTMPQWGGSCWYYLRYMDPKNSAELVSKDVVNYWGEVDSYVGGAEHAVLHLLYARFWHKFLYDIGVVPTIEPFARLRNQGMILAYAYERSNGGLVAVDLVEERDGRYYEISTDMEVKRVIAKMSKSLKNVVNPDDMISEYGTDALRMYEMVLGDFRDSAPWEPTGIVGVRRFLDRVHTTFTEGKNLAKDEMKTMKLLHKTIKKVGEDIEDYKFNTAISSLMILLNEGLPTDNEFQMEWKEKFAILLHPFAPHMAEEIWNILGHKDSIYDAEWPSYDEWMLIDDEVTIAVQVNGKLRGTFTFLNGVAQEEVAETVYNSPDIVKWIEGKEIAREIFVPNKLFSIVVKQ